MGCIPSKQDVFEQFDGDGSLTSKGRTSEKKKKHPKVSKRPPSPVIPADAPPWVTGHTVVTVHRDLNTGEVYLTEKNR
ncbi:hypothetical protein DFH94DRAFT_732789 [Russula ochroleuca]|uniref:Uncharacterized protein n=1 Tax=Russula ochroleuca TaxID=152965 RepID=A0A9P5MY84_9AGAM|nr:hypothetical protein DFH94DRAFT_732789 [Russula ochroleuca]